MFPNTTGWQKEQTPKVPAAPTPMGALWGLPDPVCTFHFGSFLFFLFSLFGPGLLYRTVPPVPRTLIFK